MKKAKAKDFSHFKFQKPNPYILFSIRTRGWVPNKDEMFYREGDGIFGNGNSRVAALIALLPDQEIEVTAYPSTTSDIEYQGIINAAARRTASISRNDMLDILDKHAHLSLEQRISLLGSFPHLVHNEPLLTGLPKREMLNRVAYCYATREEHQFARDYGITRAQAIRSATSTGYLLQYYLFEGKGIKCLAIRARRSIDAWRYVKANRGPCWPRRSTLQLPEDCEIYELHH